MDKGGFYGQESTEVDDVVDQEDAENLIQILRFSYELKLCYRFLLVMTKWLKLQRI